MIVVGSLTVDTTTGMLVNFNPFRFVPRLLPDSGLPEGTIRGLFDVHIDGNLYSGSPGFALHGQAEDVSESFFGLTAHYELAGLIGVYQATVTFTPPMDGGEFLIGTNGVEVAPEPSGFILAATGFVLVGGFWWGRKTYSSGE